MFHPHKHQKECIDAIDKHLNNGNQRGLIKMFCGSGKSLIMYNTILKHGGNLSVVVVPSISLITQFNNDYLLKYIKLPNKHYIQLTICSLNEIGNSIDFTTNPEHILNFLNRKDDKIVLITYQSLETLFNIIKTSNMTICLICFDEAHHVTAKGFQEHIFGNYLDNNKRYGFIDKYIIKALFFTATPINKNDICMFDNNNTDYQFLDILETNSCIDEEFHCGEMIYEYSHVNGVNDNVLNDFDIRVDLYTENTDTSIFEAISRTILETGNSRVLTFHSRSNTPNVNGSDVISFFNRNNKKIFENCFNKLCKEEFPSSIGYYKHISFTGLTCITKNRSKILADFDNTPDNHIYILGSCETIGEGIDTKSANMCVFVDPKQSYVKIIQNIGRICRKQLLHRNSTILIPAYVDVTKYKNCIGDLVARDKVIREEMSQSGDFNGILNCLSALRQEDPYMFELCLKTPEMLTTKELINNFKKNGLTLEQDKEYHSSALFNNFNIKYNPSMPDIDNFSLLSQQLEKNIQVTSQKIIEPNLIINKGYTKTIHFVKTDKEMFIKTIDDIKCTEIVKPHRNVIPFIHMNNDIQVLWGFTSDLDKCMSIFGGYINATIVTDNSEQWFDKLVAVKTYINNNKKRPSHHDTTYNIKKMGSWIGTQLKNYKHNRHIMKQPEINKVWFEFINNTEYKKYFNSNTEEWYRILAEVKTYIDINNKKPSTSNKEPNIKKIGQWISDQLQNFKQNTCIMKLPKIKTSWIEFINDVKYIKYFTNNDDEWYATLEAVKTYIDVNNKRPNQHDNNHNIKKMGKWISGQSVKFNLINTQSTEINKVWLEFINDIKYNKYFTSNNDEWYNTLFKIKTYIDTNKKKPSQKDKDPTIKKLGIWISSQIQNYKQNKNIMTVPEIKQDWLDLLDDQEYSKYFTSNNEEWYNILEDVKHYIDYNKILPNRIDKETKKNRRWIETQQQNYKQNKNIMKQPDIKQAWIDFINNEIYTLYFNIKLKPASKSTTIKPEIKTIGEFKESKEQRKQSEYQELTKKMAIQKSENTHKMFIDDPKLWHNYHDSRDFSFKGYNKQDEIPLNKIITYLESKKNYKLNILDLGCGRNLIKEHFKANIKFTITGYDYVSYNDSKVADISILPEDDISIKVCIYSQSLMGSNWKEYLLEGYRALEYNGEMIISESNERYNNVKEHLDAIGMYIINEEYLETNRWFYIYAIKR